MLVTPLATQRTEEMMVHVRLITRERDREWTNARNSEKCIQRGEARTENTRTPIVIARDQSTDDRGWEGESRVKVQLIRLESPWCISAVRIRRERFFHRRYLLLGVRIIWEVGESMVSPFPEVVLGNIGLPGAVGWIHWIEPRDRVVLDFWVRRINFKTIGCFFW